MKKYLIGFIAVILAIGLSAFTTINEKPEKLPLDYYWFSVNAGQGNDDYLMNSQVSYITYGSSTSQGACSGSTYSCKVGFNADQVQLVEPDIYGLKSGEHPFAVVLYKRTNP